MKRITLVLLALASGCLYPSAASAGDSSFNGAFPANGQAIGGKRSTDGRMVPFRIDGTGALVTAGGGGGGVTPVSATGTLNNDGDSVELALAGNTAASVYVSDSSSCVLAAEFQRADTGDWSNAAVYNSVNWTPVLGDLSTQTRATIAVPSGSNAVRIVCLFAGTGTPPYGVSVSLQATPAQSPFPFVQGDGIVPPTVSFTPHVTVGGIDRATSTPYALSTDAAGALNVNVLSGGGSNPSVSATGAAVPAQATYGGMSIAGNLTGLSGTTTGAVPSLNVTLRDAVGNDLEFAKENDNFTAADHGILMLGRDVDSTPDKYRVFRLDANGNLYVVGNAANNVDAEATKTTGVLETEAYGMVFNGTTWDRQYSGGTNADAVATRTLGGADTRGFLYGYNGTTWDRVRTANTGRLQVDVLTAPTTTVNGTVTAATTATSVAAAIDSGTCTNVSVSTTVLASNASRKVAVILNNGTAAVHLKLGATATTANPPLAAGQSFTIEGVNVYTGVVDVIASTGTQSVCAYSW